MDTIKFTFIRFSHLRALIVPLLGLLGSLIGGWAFFSLIATLPELTNTQVAYGITAMICNAVSYAYLGWFVREQWAGFYWRTIKTVEVANIEELPKALTDAMNDVK